MKLIVGLGNPGSKYAATRHNAGFILLDHYAERHGVSFGKVRFHGETAELRVGDEAVVLLKPQTFMNLSGRSVGAAVSFFKLDPASDVIVAHDELDLPLGAVRFKLGGGAAGHNGLKDIGATVGKDFIRLRLGIGRPPGRMEAVSFVLASYGKAEQAELVPQMDLGMDALDQWVKEGIQPAMNEIHRRQK